MSCGPFTWQRWRKIIKRFSQEPCNKNYRQPSSVIIPTFLHPKILSNSLPLRLCQELQTKRTRAAPMRRPSILGCVVIQPIKFQLMGGYGMCVLFVVFPLDDSSSVYQIIAYSHISMRVTLFSLLEPAQLLLCL